MSDTKSSPRVRITKLAKAPARPDVLTPRAQEAEDEYAPFYAPDSLATGMSLIEPPYNPAVLQGLCSANNTLGPCIAAMTTNIDETGFIIEKKEGKTDETDPTAKKLEAWFDEVFPGLSFQELRKKVRRDLEQTGNGYIEALRNVKDEVVFLRHVSSRTLRCMRLGAPIAVKKTLTRGDVTVEVNVMVRERRFAQMLGATWIYFREFGSSRQLSCTHGYWDSDSTPVELGDRGTEIIHLTVNPHYNTPYGMPRWEGQIPSVLGSRAAEEFNLDYFGAGGVPPALITLAGGSMAEEARKALETQFNSKAKSKHRIAILETQSTSGSLDSAGKVDVAVHTFGAERQSDAMFENYDARCHARVKRAFRIPALFLGDTDSYNFATAFAAYLVAESQVFRPEREAFDEVVNRLIMPEIGGEGYVFRSKNLSIADIQSKLAGLQLAGATQHVDPKQIVKAINEIADLDLTPTDKPIPPPAPPPGAPGLPGSPGAPGAGGPPNTAGAGPKPPTGFAGKPNSESSEVTKSDFNVLDLADRAMVALRQRSLQSIASVLRESDNLPPDQSEKFKAAMALRSYFDPSIEPEGMADLASCSLVGMFRSGALT